ncbi:MAG: SRPBCC domain-containing protein [Verrucomicrobiota bacterium]
MNENISNTPDAGARILVLERVFKGSPEGVFAAFASAEAISRWFGPEGCEVLEAEVDFCEGGSYRLRITTEDGRGITLVGVYQTIEPPGHLAFSWRWEDHPGFNPCDSFVEILFIDHPDGTLLRLVQTGIEDDSDRGSHVIGWSSTFNKLEALFS